MAGKKQEKYRARENLSIKVLLFRFYFSSGAIFWYKEFWYTASISLDFTNGEKEKINDTGSAPVA